MKTVAVFLLRNARASFHNFIIAREKGFDKENKALDVSHSARIGTCQGDKTYGIVFFRDGKNPANVCWEVSQKTCGILRR